MERRKERGERREEKAERAEERDSYKVNCRWTRGELNLLPLLHLYLLVVTLLR